MASIVPGSTLSFSSSVNYFDIPATDLTTVSSDVALFYAVSSFRDNENPIQFVVLGSPNHFLDLLSARISAKVRIVKANETNTSLTTYMNVAPTHNFFPALFQSCEVTLNGTPVSRCTSFYSYIHHITDLLSFSQESKATYLSTQLYIPDTDRTKFDSTNKGHTARKLVSQQSAVFEVSGRINE